MDVDSSIKITRSIRRSISIRILPGGVVEVKAPIFMSMAAIHKFLADKEDWLNRHRKKMQARPIVNKKTYEDGDKFLYLGQEVLLTFGNYQAIHVQENRLLVPAAMKFRIKKEIEIWYIKQARTIITKLVHDNAQTMNVSYKSLSFSDTKSKWGSCSHDNHLQFCWRLIMAPVIVANYVVIHELAHTIQKNHSDDFWTIVRRYNPSYKQQIKWLKIHGGTIVL